MKIEEMKDQVESFYSHLIVNIYNFPPRNQSVDNNKSLLNEVSLHYDIMGFLSDFAQTETTDTTYKKTISDQNFMTLELSKSAKFKILRKNISKSNPFPMDLKHLKKEKEIWNSSLKGNNNYASFLNKIGIKKIAFDETHLDNRLNIKAIQEEIQKLNQKMGNSFPDTIEFERINLFFSNNSIFSFLKGPQNTMKVIIRNISGKYSWVIKLFDAIGSDCIIKKYDNKGLEFKSYKNMIVQQEPGNSKRNRAITQTQEYFELKTLIRRPEKGKVALTLLKSVETIEKENDFSQTLKDIVGKIEEFCQVKN